MTPSSPPRPQAPVEKGAAALRRGLAALLVLALLGVGPPAALITFVGNPLPAHPVIGGQLTDDAVIGMLAAVVWLAWAQLVLAVAVEAVAAIRGIGLPRQIPLSGPHQLLARHLVFPVVFLLAGGTAIAGAEAAGQAVAVATSSTSGGAPPVNLTQSQMTPIAAGTSLPDSSASAGDSIHGRAVDLGTVPGILRDPPLEPLASERAEVAGHWYVVKPPRGSNHDTLWDIAERHLGDGLRWKEIYDLNKGRPQADGSELHLARLIYPGWRLLLPLDAVGLPDPDVHLEAEDRPASPGDPGTGTGAEPVDREAATVRTTVTSRTGGTPVMDGASHLQPGAVGHDAMDADDRAGRPMGALTLGLSAIACAGLTAELARRRQRAQRHRRPGERLRRPSVPADRLGRQLHAASAGVSVQTLRDALRAMDAAAHRSDRPLPDLHTVRINAAGLTLRLGSDEPDAVAPFTAMGPRTWILDADTPIPPTPAPALSWDRTEEWEDEYVDPYPALVAVGVVDDCVLLVNLEAAGTLHIAGPAEESTQIVHAIAAELGTSALSNTAVITMTGCPPQLERLFDSGLTDVVDPDKGRACAALHEREIARILTDAGLQDMRAAREQRLVSDIWAPEILIEDPGAADGERTGARALPTPPPYRGLCVITTSRPGPRQGAGWTLTATEGRWRLDPAGVHIDPQRLDPARLAECAELLTIARDPAPSLATSTPPPAGRIPGPSTGEPARKNGNLRPTASTTRTAPSPTDLTILALAIPEPPRPAELPSDEPGPKSAITTTEAPRVLVLGPVDIVDATEEVQQGRRRRATELLAFLALRPGASQHQLDEALWPGLRISRKTRNPLVSRARQWLGEGPHGPYVEVLSEGQRYNLRPEVTCDWHDFYALAKRGLAAGAAGLDDLISALDLVRGRPFLGVHPSTYSWADADTEDMISSIVDVAHAVAALSVESGDHRRARWAAAKGISVDPCAELLYQDAVRAAAQAGDDADVERWVAALRRHIAEIDPADDMSDETGSVVAASRQRRV